MEKLPERIVSLVPSTTETLFAVGASDRVVGVTRFCVHPREARERARIVGGTKNPRLDGLLSLEPDLVLANQEENRREDVERLRERGVRVEVFFPRNASDAIADIRSLGQLVGEPDRARALAFQIERALADLKAVERRRVRYLYFIWRRPYRVAGPETFLEALLAEAGFVNAAPQDRGRYPEMGIEEVAHSRADVLLLSSEPFPFEEKHRAELIANVGSDREVFLVDGELLSWHGARLRQGLPYLSALAERVSSSTSASARPFPDPSP